MVFAPLHRSRCTHVFRMLAWTALVAVALLARPTFAQDPQEPAATPLDRGHDMIGRTLNTVARAIDRFFSNSTEFTDAKGNWARLGLNVRAREDGVREYSSDVALRLALPKTAKKYNLVLQSDSDAETEPVGFRDPLSAATSPVYSGGMRYIISQKKDSSANVDVGADLTTPIDAYLRGRTRRTFHWGRWQLRAAETLTKYQSGRQNALTELTLDRLLAPDWLWRNYLGAKIAHPISESVVVLSDSIYHRINERHAYQFELLGRGLDGPARVHEYQVNFRYRIRSKKRNWVYYEIAPQELYSEDFGFKPLASIYFRIEFLFTG
jgi:hypothetical protein